jgi:hypothetical protein
VLAAGFYIEVCKSSLDFFNGIRDKAGFAPESRAAKSRQAARNQTAGVRTIAVSSA